MTRRLGALVVVMLIGSVADAESAEAHVRGVIDSFRSEDSRRHWKVTFDPATAVVPGPMVCEYMWDEGDQYRYGLVRFVPRPDTVSVLALALTTLPEDGPSWTPTGCRVREAIMAPEAYADLVEGAHLLVRARLARRTDPMAPPAPQRQGRWHVGTVRVRFDALWEGKGELTPAVWVDEGLVETSIPTHGRAFLVEHLLTRSLADLTLEPVETSIAALIAVLRRELASTKGWRRDLRAAFLGWLGGVEELEALRATSPLTPITARACQQIELLGDATRSENGLERLLNLTTDPDAGLSAWARVVVRANFADAYKEKLKRDYRSATDGNARRAVLLEHVEADPGDDSLLREALEDPEPSIRATAARHLGRWRVLLKIANDRTVRREGDVDGRVQAVHALGRLSIANRDVGDALVRIVFDSGDDVQVRREAAEAIGCLGYGEAVPQLVAFLAKLQSGAGRPKARSRVRHIASVGVIRALGLLRARQSSDLLLRILRNGVEENDLDERGLAAAAGEALARIGDPRAESWLRQACGLADVHNAENKLEWYRRLRLLGAICAGDGARILEVFDDGRVLVRASGWLGSCDRYWIDLLADVVAVDDLRRLATVARGHEKWREAALVREALKRKAGR